MSKEHSGGIPLVAWTEEEYDVPFTWDPASIDTLSELIGDHVKTGGDPRDVMLKALAPEIRLIVASALRRLIYHVRGADKPKLAADQISWLCGLALIDGETIGTLSKAHGISKQAFQQGANKFRELLIIKSQSARDDQAREKMKKRNYRRGE